jgi:HAD superfamily hydrolase (TIGR01509 family)
MGSKSVRGIIFDLDGVLVDAAPWHYEALQKALSLFGYQISPEEHSAVYNGLPTRVKLLELSKRTPFPFELHEFVNEMKQKYTREIFVKHCAPCPRLTSTLNRLKSDGYRLGVASNSSQETIETALNQLGIRSFFEVVLSHEKTGKPKPDPALYLEACRRLGIAPGEALVLEDSEPGMRAARAAGTHLWQIHHVTEVTLSAIQQQIETIETRHTYVDPTIEILIPMAGNGHRFSAAGFTRPKPFIDVMGRPMIEWVVANVLPKRFPARFTFLVNQEHLHCSDYRKCLESIAPHCRIVSVPSTTQGAACTALLAADVLSPNRRLVVVNSDQWVQFDMDAYLQNAARAQCDGSILCFPATEEKWSYAATDEQGWVTRVAEKEVISHQATVGIYYFKTARTFFDCAKEMIRKEIRTRSEFYVCPIYNELIQSGGRVMLQSIPADRMHGLGTPEDLEQFLLRHPSQAPTTSDTCLLA